MVGHEGRNRARLFWTLAVMSLGLCLLGSFSRVRAQDDRAAPGSLQQAVELAELTEQVESELDARLDVGGAAEVGPAEQGDGGPEGGSLAAELQAADEEAGIVAAGASSGEQLEGEQQAQQEEQEALPAEREPQPQQLQPELEPEARSAEGAAQQQQQPQQPAGGGAVETRLLAGERPGSPTFPGFCRKYSPPQVPDLRVRRVWRSAAPRPAGDVALVTQLSIERLYMLEGQCAAWGGTIAAAVHVPLVDGKVVSGELPALNGSAASEPERMLAEFHAKMEAAGGCKLDVAFVVEEVPGLEFVGLYPVNALRNRALQLAQTEVLLLLDADFLPSRGLSEELAAPESYATLLRALGHKQAVVLPAFETADDGEAGRDVALEAVQDKASLQRLFASGAVQGFHMDHYNMGHRATDFTRWLGAKVAYRIAYEEGYEPYVLVARRYVPWYDERFKGYRKNKVVHLMHLQHLGLNFVATPRAWVVHSPHPTANSWTVTKSTGFWYKLKRLYNEARSQMEASAFVPVTAFRCESKRAERWSWYRRLQR